MRAAVTAPFGPHIWPPLSVTACSSSCSLRHSHTCCCKLTACGFLRATRRHMLPWRQRRRGVHEQLFLVWCQLTLFPSFQKKKKKKEVFYTLPPHSLLYILARSWPFIWELMHSLDNRQPAGVGSDSVIFIFHFFFFFFCHTHTTRAQRHSCDTNIVQGAHTNQLRHKLHTHFKQTHTGANPGAGTVCLCVWICITQPTPGRSQSAPLKVHKSWMFWPVITRPPAFQACGVPESDRQPSSLGLKQTLWNVLMGRELILGLNLSGSRVQPPSISSSSSQPEPRILKTNISWDTEGCEAALDPLPIYMTIWISKPAQLP